MVVFVSGDGQAGRHVPVLNVLRSRQLPCSTAESITKGSSEAAASEYLTPGQVAKILNVTVRTVLRRFGGYPGVIDLSSPPIKRGTRPRRLLRIPRGVLNRYLYEHRVRK